MYPEILLLKATYIEANLPQQKLPTLAFAQQKCLLVFLLLSLLFILSFSSAGHARDFLTDKEIERLQETQSVAARTRIYMDAAALRLKTVKDKLSNKEYEAGDPMELLMPEEVIDAYCKILRSVHLITGYAIEAPNRKGNESVEKALTILKAETTIALKELDILLRMAEEKQRNLLSGSINDAIDVTNDTFNDTIEKLGELHAKTPH